MASFELSECLIRIQDFFHWGRQFGGILSSIWRQIEEGILLGSLASFFRLTCIRWVKNSKYLYASWRICGLFGRMERHSRRKIDFPGMDGEIAVGMLCNLSRNLMVTVVTSLLGDYRLVWLRLQSYISISSIERTSDPEYVSSGYMGIYLCRFGRCMA